MASRQPADAALFLGPPRRRPRARYEPGAAAPRRDPWAARSNTRAQTQRGAAGRDRCGDGLCGWCRQRGGARARLARAGLTCTVPVRLHSISHCHDTTGAPTSPDGVCLAESIMEGVTWAKQHVHMHPNSHARASARQSLTHRSACRVPHAGFAVKTPQTRGARVAYRGGTHNQGGATRHGNVRLRSHRAAQQQHQRRRCVGIAAELLKVPHENDVEALKAPR